LLKKEILGGLSSEQLSEIIKEANRIHIKKQKVEAISDEKIPEEKFLLNPQQEGLWVLSLSLTNIPVIIDSDSLREEESRFGRYSRYRPTSQLRKVLDFLFKLLPEKEKENLREQEFMFRRRDVFPFRSVDVPRLSYRQLRARKEKFPIDVKKKYVKQFKVALDEYRNNLMNYNYFAVEGRDEFDNLINFDTGQIMRILSSYMDFTVISLHKEILNSLVTILRSLEIVEKNSVKLTKLLRPEKDLMAHYVHIFGASKWKETLENPNVIDSVRLAVEEFENRRYSYSIRSSGLSMEEILVDVYETFLRKNAPHGDQATLTHLIQNIMTETKDLVHSQKIGPKKTESEFDFSRINNLITSNEQNGNQDIVDLGKILRELMQNAIELKKHNIIKQPAEEPILFPQQVLESIQQTTKLRNDVSHRRQSEIGVFEAAKALHGVYLISKWWNNEKSLIDWDSTKEDILIKALERNKN